MQDPWNATAAEIEEWAGESDAMWPEQDWDLSVTRKGNVDLILRLASDDAGPNRHFFLRCLYLLVGDAVRTNYRVYDRTLLQRLLERVDDRSASRLRRWRDRSYELLAQPKLLSPDLWCAGGFAEQERKDGS